MKRLVICLIIVCCICYMHVFANSMLEICRLSEKDFDLLLSHECNFTEIGNINMDVFNSGDTVNINGSAILADALKEYVFSEERIREAVVNYNSIHNTDLVLTDYKIFTVFSENDHAWPYLIWINTNNGCFIGASYLDDNYDYAFNLLTSEEAKERFSESLAEVYINNDLKSMDYAVIKGNIALISLRSVAESLGLSIEWFDGENSVLLSNEGKQLKIYIAPDNTMDAYDIVNNNRIYINGSNMVLEPCVWVDDRIILNNSQINSIFMFFFEDEFRIRVDNNKKSIIINKNND